MVGFSRHGPAILGRSEPHSASGRMLRYLSDLFKRRPGDERIDNLEHLRASHYRFLLLEIFALNLAFSRNRNIKTKSKVKCLRIKNTHLKMAEAFTTLG